MRPSFYKQVGVMNSICQHQYGKKWEATHVHGNSYGHSGQPVMVNIGITKGDANWQYNYKTQDGRIIQGEYYNDFNDTFVDEMFSSWLKDRI